ncbi:MAG: ABC transporter ATP-binding protein [Dokdonia sp.]|jgi:ABC-type polysaccharide/polyol phosphate transport system ATPase subunit
MDDTVILRAENLKKVYDIGDGKKIAALDAISFELHKGEILGIIGSNGAGKSTLLKVLSRITGLTSGEITYTGTLTSIIDIGTGFHPDLSGRENVLLSTGLLNPSNKLPTARYQQIVAFSGLSEFMEMPVKQYSSGMYLRLAFSIAFHTAIDILLLDEVIAVGDNTFRKKCYDKIRELKQQGVGIILVSHNMETIIEFSDRCLFLNNGKVVQNGEPYSIVERYLNWGKLIETDQVRSNFEEVSTQENITYYKDLTTLALDFVTFKQFEIVSKKAPVDILQIDKDIDIHISGIMHSDKHSLELTYYLTNLNNVRIFLDSYGLRPDYKTAPWKKGSFEVCCTIPKNLLNIGVFTLGIIISKNYQPIAEFDKIASFKLYNENKTAQSRQVNCAVKPQLEWTIKQNKNSDK